MNSERKKYTMLWDLNFQTDRVIETTRPGLVLDAENRVCQISNFKVLNDENIVISATKIIAKRQDLAVELQKRVRVKWKVQESWKVLIKCTAVVIGVYLNYH